MRPQAILCALLLALAAPAAWAQSFTKEDSGWVPLFNGRNFDGLYSRMYSKEVTDIPNKTFSVDSGMIKVTQGSGWEQGHIGTDKRFTHYRARVEYKFEGTSGNAGFTYHTDETVPRMSNNWPRSIECQMMQGNAGRAYSIAMATFTTRATNGSYNPNGTVVDVCEKTSGGLCDARDYGASVILDKRGQWNKMEIVVRGSDSALHRVNDSTVMRVWNIRIPTDANATAFTPYGSGSLAVQAEGANIAYKNWEIMELPADGPNWLQRLFLTNTDGGARLTPGGTHAITWRTLGDVKKVSLFWHAGDGKWEMMADNITNTGTFTWTVPTAPTQTLRVKVSAAPWVKADSSAADNSIGPGSGLGRKLTATWENPAGLRGRDAAGRASGADTRPGRRVLYHGLR